MQATSKNLRALIQPVVSFCLVSILFLILAPSAEAGAQRMLISAGRYRVGTRTARIPAFCIDLNRSRPFSPDSFRGVSGSLDAAKVIPLKNGKPLSDPFPFSRGLEQGLYSLTGTPRGSTQELEVKILKHDWADSLDIIVDSPITVGKDKTDADEGAKIISPLLRSIAKLDDLVHRASTRLGEESGIVEQLKNTKSTFIWDATTTRSSFHEQSVDRLLKDLRARFTDDKDPAESLRFVSILHGDQLSVDQVRAVQEILGIKLAVTYDAGFLKELKSFKQARERLQSAFGKGDRLLRQYVDDVARQYGSSHDLLLARKEAAEGLVPPEVRSSPVSGDLFSLLQGERLTAEQATALSEATGMQITAPAGALDDYVLLSNPLDDPLSPIRDRVLLRTTESQKSLSLLELKSEIGQTTLKSKHVVIKGLPITPEVAQKLFDSNIVLFHNYADFIRQPISGRQDLELVFVASPNNPTLNDRIFEKQAPASVTRAVVLAKQEKLCAFVPTHEQLRQKIRSAAKEGKKLLIIFHNGKDGVVFADANIPTPLHELAKEFGDSAPVCLSCETYAGKGFTYRTTGILDVENLVKALIKTKVTYGTTNVELNDFLASTVQQYNEGERSTKRLALAGVGGGLGTLGLTIFGALVAGSGQESGTPVQNDDDGKKKGRQKQSDKQGDRKPMDDAWQSHGNQIHLDREFRHGG